MVRRRNEGSRCAPARAEGGGGRCAAARRGRACCFRPARAWPQPRADRAACGVPPRPAPLARCPAPPLNVHEHHNTRNEHTPNQAPAAHLDHVQRAVHPHNVHYVEVVAPGRGVGAGRDGVRVAVVGFGPSDGWRAARSSSGRAKAQAERRTASHCPAAGQLMRRYARPAPRPASAATHTAVSSSCAQNRKPPSPEMEMARLSVGHPPRLDTARGDSSSRGGMLHWWCSELRRRGAAVRAAGSGTRDDDTAAGAGAGQPEAADEARARAVCAVRAPLTCPGRARRAPPTWPRAGSRPWSAARWRCRPGAGGAPAGGAVGRGARVGCARHGGWAGVLASRGGGRDSAPCILHSRQRRRQQHRRLPPPCAVPPHPLAGSARSRRGMPWPPQLHACEGGPTCRWRAQ